MTFTVTPAIPDPNYPSEEAGTPTPTNEAFIQNVPFTAIGGQTTFEVEYELGSVFLVTKDGIGVTFTATDGANVVLDAAASAGELVNIFISAAFTVAGAASKSGDTMTGPLALSKNSTAVTPAASDNSTKIANTAWVYSAMSTVMSYFGFASALGGTTGYIKFPSILGGLIIQWGQAVTNVLGGATFTYPLAMTTQTFAAYGNYLNTSTNAAYLGVTIKSSTLTTVSSYISDAAGSPVGSANIGFLVIGK